MRIADAWRGAAEQLAPWGSMDPERLILVGSGTSLNALMVAAPELANGYRRVDVVNPRSFLQMPIPSPGTTCVVVLSQTGTSDTSVQSVTRAQSAGAVTITLTADLESPIAQVARRTLHLPVGDEPVGPKTKGYTVSLAVLSQLSNWMNGKSMDAAVPVSDLDALLPRAEAAATALAEELDAVDYIAIAGEERHYGTAQEGSLKISEICGVPAAGFTTEELLHGRLHGLSERSLCVMIAATAEHKATAEHVAAVMQASGVRILGLDLRGEAGPFGWPSDMIGTTPPFDAMAGIIPIQWLAMALARRRGMEPHRMRYPGLSQRLGIKLARTA
ncbi:SIS domain-containing protein [Arenibaculum pallidiluteum]|uniref:SIS domain-containing protein n=1 Tax=Arenibaculum pallidiluteum TaxID=2812559 RepID=UPI001A96E59C|nr:SIS domain-containing protein [Arenibaculum pallidiluteum]